MIKRQIVILLSLLMILAACGGTPTPSRTDITVPASVPTDEANAIEIDPFGMVVVISPKLHYVTPNPGARWATVGPRIFVEGDYTTLIDPEIMGNFVGDDADLTELYPEYTAADLEIEETESGEPYVIGVNSADILEIYMIKSGYLMRFLYGEGVAPPRSAYDDFVRIATEGDLVELD